MVKNVHFHEKLEGANLDDYLARGWFRIGQLIFTTDYVPFAEGFYRVFWLRFRLNRYQFKKKQQKLFSANQQFRVLIEPFAINEEREELYGIYYSQLSFTASPTLQSNLLDFGIGERLEKNVYDSRVIEIRDRDKLIAVGVFDRGKNSIAGILNYYDPAYKKYSLGKYLMLLKLKYAMDNNYDFYYPGYIAPDYHKFDYKLFPGAEAAELFDPLTEQWFPYNEKRMQELKDNPPINFIGG